MRYSILGTWTTLGDPTNVLSHVWGEVSNISNISIAEVLKTSSGYLNLLAIKKHRI